ncbi:MAG: glycosyltransferase, partial [Longimicrobiales bacterium]
MTLAGAVSRDYRIVDWPTHGPPGRRRVLQVTEDLGVGGLERVIATLCRNLDPRRFDPAVVCLRDGGEFADELELEGVPIFQLPYDPSRADYFAFRQVARILRRHHVDVVHTHNTGAFVAGGVGALLARTPTLIHTDHARDFPDKLRYVVAENLLSRLAHRVVGVSEHTTENLVRYERLPRKKLVTIHNGIDVAVGASGGRPEELRRELGI